MKWLEQSVILLNNKEALINCDSEMSSLRNTLCEQLRAFLATDWEESAAVRWSAQIAVGAVPGLVIVFTIMFMASGAPRRGTTGTSAASIVPLLSATALVDSAAFHRVPTAEVTQANPVKFRMPGTTLTTGSQKRVLMVVKKTSPMAVNFKAPRQSWVHLDAECRQAIDAGLAKSADWQRVVLHGSGSSHGNARLLDRYHAQIRGLKGGLDYHFIIGNGSGAADGGVQAGPRWFSGRAAEALPLAGESIHVCFVGDFQTQSPTAAQLQALDELMDYLSIKIGDVPVTSHSGINGEETRCLGAKFPMEQVMSAIGR